VGIVGDVRMAIETWVRYDPAMVVGANSLRGRAPVAALVVALGLATRLAIAQPSSPPPETPVGAEQGAEARRTALYREGIDLGNAGRWSDACDRFRAVLSIRSSAKVYFSLAQAEEQLGQVASAQADYGRALESARAAGEFDVVQAVDQARAKVDPRVPHVRLVSTGPGHATATLDGHPVPLGIAIAVDPGTHQVLSSAPGMRDATTSVAIGERQELDVPIVMRPAGAPSPLAATPQSSEPAAPPNGTPEAPHDASTSPVPFRPIALATAGLGVVGLGIGIAFGLQAKAKNDQSNSEGCAGTLCPNQSGVSLRQDALSAANVSTLAFVVGGLLATGGVVLWLVAPPATPDRAAGVGVSPVALGVGGGGFAVAGGW